MRHLINQMGSVDDIRSSLKSSCHSLADLHAALDNEKSKKAPRQTVIKMIEAKIKRINKNLEALKI